MKPVALAREGNRIHAPALAVGITVLAAAAYSWMSIYRNDHFASNAFDLGDQDQTIWGYSRFEIIPNTVLGIPNLLGDHFHPVLMVLAPLDWIWNTPDAILAAQGVLLSLAGVPIFFWAAERLGALAGLAFQASYLLFWGLLAGVVYDFHHIAFAVPATSAALYATVTHRNRLLWAAVAVCMLTREDVALTVAALGLYIAVVQRRALLGVGLAVLNVAWFLVLIEAVMPALGGAPYRHWTYQGLGPTPLRALEDVVLHPLAALRLLFDPLEKVRVWIGLLGNWLFLPVLSPLFIVAVPSLLERFWSSEATLWSFHYQYSLLQGPILAFAAIDSAVRLSSRLKANAAAAVARGLAAASLALGATVSLAVVRPLSELTTYVPDSRVAEIQSCLDVIPADASVSASNFLLPHLDHRRQIYLVTASTNADYIAIDVSTYQHFSPGEEDGLRATVRASLGFGYGVACTRGGTVVLKRGADDKSLSPQLERWLAAECSGRGCE